MLGMSHRAAADFTFIMAVPIMFGASLLSLLKLGILHAGGSSVLHRRFRGGLRLRLDLHPLLPEAD